MVSLETFLLWNHFTKYILREGRIANIHAARDVLYLRFPSCVFSNSISFDPALQTKSSFKQSESSPDDVVFVHYTLVRLPDLYRR